MTGRLSPIGAEQGLPHQDPLEIRGNSSIGSSARSAINRAVFFVQDNVGNSLQAVAHVSRMGTLVLPIRATALALRRFFNDGQANAVLSRSVVMFCRLGDFFCATELLLQEPASAPLVASNMIENLGVLRQLIKTLQQADTIVANNLFVCAIVELCRANRLSDATKLIEGFTQGMDRQAKNELLQNILIGLKNINLIDNCVALVKRYFIDQPDAVKSLMRSLHHDFLTGDNQANRVLVDALMSRIILIFYGCNLLNFASELLLEHRLIINGLVADGMIANLGALMQLITILQQAKSGVANELFIGAIVELCRANRLSDAINLIEGFTQGMGQEAKNELLKTIFHGLCFLQGIDDFVALAERFVIDHPWVINSILTALCDDDRFYKAIELTMLYLEVYDQD